jgi:predicted MPP superfamily phosphohydrolase
LAIGTTPAPLPSSGAELQRLGIHLLRNKASQVRPGIWVAGFDDAVAGFPNMEHALGGIPSDGLTIALFHSPAYFDELASRVSIAFVGHTHGGQIRLPFLNPLWLPRGSGEYISGWYEKRTSRMYVSRGIGMTILPFRLLCRPEVALVTLKPARL